VAQATRSKPGSKNVDVHVRTDEGPRGAPAVVLLHGQPGSATDWSFVAHELVPPGGFGPGPRLRVITVDRPGYGTCRQPVTDWAGNARALVSLLDRLDIEKAFVGGWSWAGGIGLRAAIDTPDRIAGLVLVGSVGHRAALSLFDYVLAAPPLVTGIPLVLGRIAPSGARLARLLGLPRRESDITRYLVDEARLRPTSRAWFSFSAEQRFLVHDTPALSAALWRVRVPVRVVHGWDDQVVPLRAAGALVSSLPDASLEVADGGHLLPLDHPRLVAEAIRGLVEERLSVSQ
jgi:pimeloyl-ACP methyl ester carboxylesterase